MTFHYKIRRSSAFTILEMLIVMVILALSVSMVSPFLFNQIAGYKQKSELHKLESFIDSVRDRSFFSGKSNVIVIDNGEVSCQGEILNFNYITPLDQKLIISNRYQIFPDHLKYIVINSSEEKVLNLND